MATTLPALNLALLELRQVFLPITPTTLGGKVAAPGGELHVLATLEEDGDYLRLRTLQLCTYGATSPRFAALMEQITALNIRHDLARIGWDPSDGEVSVEVALPIHGHPQVPLPHLATALKTLTDVAAAMRGVVRQLADGRAAYLPAATHAPAARQSAPPSQATGATAPVAPRQTGGFNLLGLGVILLGVAALLAAVRWVFI